MPPNIDQFEKLIELRQSLAALVANEAEAGERFLTLLPGLLEVFGPAFPAAVHAHLSAIEAGLHSESLERGCVERRSRAISQALGISFSVE